MARKNAAEAIRTALTTHPGMTAKEAALAAGVGVSTAGNVLAAWEKENAAYRETNGKGAAQWYIRGAEPVAEPTTAPTATDLGADRSFGDTLAEVLTLNPTTDDDGCGCCAMNPGECPEHNPTGVLDPTHRDVLLSAMNGQVSKVAARTETEMRGAGLLTSGRRRGYLALTPYGKTVRAAALADDEPPSDMHADGCAFDTRGEACDCAGVTDEPKAEPVTTDAEAEAVMVANADAEAEAAVTVAEPVDEGRAAANAALADVIAATLADIDAETSASTALDGEPLSRSEIAARIAAAIPDALLAKRPKAARPGRRTDGSGLGKNALRDMITEHLRANPSTAFTPTQMAKALDQLTGSVAYALGRLADDGVAVLVNAAPKTYRIAS